MKQRLIDAFDLAFTQDDVAFAIPDLTQDLPLYLDPFLLWSSANDEYRELHERVVRFLEHFGGLARDGRDADAARFLLTCEEPRELGLGYAAHSKSGSFIGPATVRMAAEMYRVTPQLQNGRLEHIEELGLLVPKIAEDRISDLTACALREFFVDFTIEQAAQHRIPTQQVRIPPVFDFDAMRWKSGLLAKLPYNPLDGTPLLFAPLDLLRHLPWINYPDYYRSYFARHVLRPSKAKERVPKTEVLAHNRSNFEHVQRYVRQKEQAAALCKPDPLYEPLAESTLARKLKAIESLPTGAGEPATTFEDAACDLLSSALYPELEFAETQVRTVSGAHIRDLLFYNDAKTTFTRTLRDDFDAKQVVFELKNVQALEPEHVNQLYRYLDGTIGRLGVLVARTPPGRAVRQNIADLHSSKRHAIVCLDDADLRLMLELQRAGRRPVEAIKKKFVEFTRSLPK